MSDEVPQAPRRDAVRDFALVAGVSIDRLVRAPTTRLPKPVLIGGVLTAAAVAALAQLAGGDFGGGFGAGQPGLLAALLPSLSDDQPAG